MALKTTAGIHWEALRLVLKGTPCSVTAGPNVRLMSASSIPSSHRPLGSDL